MYTYLQWRFIYSNYSTISELIDRFRPRPNTKDVPRCVLSYILCPPWLAAEVLGQVGGLTVPNVVHKHVDVNKVLRDQRLADV